MFPCDNSAALLVTLSGGMFMCPCVSVSVSVSIRAEETSGNIDFHIIYKMTKIP